MKKGFLATILALCLVLGLMPGEAWASHADNSGEVKLLSLSVTDSGSKVISLLDKGVSVSLGRNYSFSATFSNADRLGEVYIASTKGNETKYLEAYRDGSAFVTRGFFDGDANYVPGKISVEYTKKIEDTPITADVSWNEIESVLGNSGSVKIDSSSGDSVKATVDISELLKSEWKELIDFSADSYDEITDGNLSDWLGAYKDLDKFKKYLLDDGAYTLYLDDSDSSTYAMILRSSTGNTYTKLILKDMSDSFDSMSKVAENISSASKVTKVMADVLDINKEASALRQEISNSTISSDQKQQLNQHVDNYEYDRSMFTVLMAVLPAVAVASGGTMTGPALVFNAIISVMNGAADTFWDYRIGMIRGSDALDVNFSSTGACGTPLTEEYIDNHVVSSGTYYISKNVISIDIGTDEKPADVTLCLHGNNINSIHVSKNSVLHLCDCMYLSEDPYQGGGCDGLQTGTGSKVFLTNGRVGGSGSVIIGGEFLIDGGVSSSPKGTDGSKITLANGTIYNGISAESNGEIVIYNGTVVGGLRADSGSVKISGGQVSSASSKSGSILVDGGSIDGIGTNTGEITVRDGTIGRISIGKGSKVYISGGEITAASEMYGRGEAIMNAGGEITIHSGKILGVDKGYCITNCDGGTLTIEGGTLQNENGDCINNVGSIVNIKGGTFQASRHYVLHNADGEVTISGGTFESSGEKCIQSGGKMTITGGTFIATAEYGQVIHAGDALTVSGGRFQGWKGIYYSHRGNLNPSASLSISGGTFQTSLHAVYLSGGSTTISGGAFQTTDETIYAGSGEMTISGGVFQSDEDAALDMGLANSAVTVTGGIFCGTYGISAIGTQDGVKATFSITPETDIKIDATECALFGFSYSDVEFKILAADNYIGSVTYYKSASDGGTKMTIQDAQEYITEHSYLPYLRLTADGVTPVSKPGDLGGDGKVTLADVIRLARGAAGYVTLTEQEQTAGDVTGDGKITMADVIRVARYAAGYSTTL